MAAVVFVSSSPTYGVLVFVAFSRDSFSHIIQEKKKLHRLNVIVVRHSCFFDKSRIRFMCDSWFSCLCWASFKRLMPSLDLFPSNPISCKSQFRRFSRIIFHGYSHRKAFWPHHLALICHPPICFYATVNIENCSIVRLRAKVNGRVLCACLLSSSAERMLIVSTQQRNL